MQHHRFLPFVAALAVGILGCAGDLESPERFNAQFGDCPDIAGDIIPNDCAKANCHKPPTLMGKLDLSQPDLVAALTNKKANGGPGLLIDGTHPEESVLYTKLGSPPPFLSQMPLVGAKLDPGVQACFLTWIEDSLKGKAP